MMWYLSITSQISSCRHLTVIVSALSALCCKQTLLFCWLLPWQSHFQLWPTFSVLYSLWNSPQDHPAFHLSIRINFLGSICQLVQHVRICSLTLVARVILYTEKIIYKTVDNITNRSFGGSLCKTPVWVGFMLWVGFPYSLVVSLSMLL